MPGRAIGLSIHKTKVLAKPEPAHAASSANDVSVASFPGAFMPGCVTGLAIPKTNASSVACPAGVDMPPRATGLSIPKAKVLATSEPTLAASSGKVAGASFSDARIVTPVQLRAFPIAAPTFAGPVQAPLQVDSPVVTEESLQDLPTCLRNRNAFFKELQQPNHHLASSLVSPTYFLRLFDKLLCEYAEQGDEKGSRANYGRAMKALLVVSRPRKFPLLAPCDGIMKALVNNTPPSVVSAVSSMSSLSPCPAVLP